MHLHVYLVSVVIIIRQINVLLARQDAKHALTQPQIVSLALMDTY